MTTNAGRTLTAASLFAVAVAAGCGEGSLGDDGSSPGTASSGASTGGITSAGSTTGSGAAGGGSTSGSGASTSGSGGRASSTSGSTGSGGNPSGSGGGSSGSGGDGGSASVELNPWDEQAGPIQQLPYRDWFRSDPIAGGRTESGDGATNTWGAPGTGWDGERALVINPPPTGLEDTSGIAAQQLPGGVRRINATYLARWNTTAASGVMDSKWFLLARGNDNGYIEASNPYPGLSDNGGSGELRFNAQGMNYGGGLADFPPNIGQLPTPMRGVTWPQMPFIEEASLGSFGSNEANADTWVCWEFEADLDTGYYLAFMTLEGGVTKLVTGYNIYDPPTSSEGAAPLAEPALTLSDSSIVWYSTGGPGGFPYFEGLPVGSEFRISHFTIAASYVGPPPGFAADGSRPPVDGSAYQVGVYSGNPVLEPAP